MKLRLEAKGAPAGRIEVIPNWVDTEEIAPQPRRQRLVGASRASTD